MGQNWEGLTLVGRIILIHMFVFYSTFVWAAPGVGDLSTQDLHTQSDMMINCQDVEIRMDSKHQVFMKTLAMGVPIETRLHFVKPYGVAPVQHIRFFSGKKNSENLFVEFEDIGIEGFKALRFGMKSESGQFDHSARVDLRNPEVCQGHRMTELLGNIRQLAMGKLAPPSMLAWDSTGKTELLLNPGDQIAILMEKAKSSEIEVLGNCEVARLSLVDSGQYFGDLVPSVQVRNCDSDVADGTVFPFIPYAPLNDLSVAPEDRDFDRFSLLKAN